ncbi:MAG: type 1 glutamine amidotransferase [Deltaproteobacteria bacterium]|nr:type 1 glutamine amidotransferase [Deltaproteobacteria bacterium]
MGKLGRMRIAVIVADGFEQSELDVPVAALRESGVAVDVLAPDEAHHRHVRGEAGGRETAGVQPDRLLADASPGAYDGLVIPGGIESPRAMRGSDLHLHWVRNMVERGRPIAAICHGPWLLAAADVVGDRLVTSHPDCRDDLERAGARWVDQEVVVDRGVVTSRRPQDLPAFVRAYIDLLEREYLELACPPAPMQEQPIDGGAVQLTSRGTAPSLP